MNSPSIPDPGRREKLTEIFVFTFLCGAAKGFMKAFKRFYEGLKGLHKTF